MKNERYFLSQGFNVMIYFIYQSIERRRNKCAILDLKYGLYGLHCILFWDQELLEKVHEVMWINITRFDKC